MRLVCSRIIGEFCYLQRPMASVAKDRRGRGARVRRGGGSKVGACWCWKRGSLGQPSQRPTTKVGSHPIEKISHRSSSYNNGCVGFNHARCWSDVGLTKGNAKYKKEISKQRKADWRRKSGSAQTGGGSEIQHALHRASYRVS
jgi:hypothetical protein